MKLDQLVTEDRVAGGLQYLAESDEQAAELKANVQRTEYLAKLAEAFAYKAVSVGSVEDRKSEARMAKAVQEAWETHFQAISAYEQVRAKRERQALGIEVWRSMNANRRVGNV